MESTENNHKYIILCHIYSTSNSSGGDSFTNWRENDEQLRYFDIVRLYSDKIVAHINGHDHLADLRFHHIGEMFNKDENCTEILPLNTNEENFYFNQIIIPGMTPNTFTNPGFMYFDYNP